jgi:competence protein ComEC
MTQSSSVILCIAYILGLLSTAVSWGGYAIVAVGIGTAAVLPRFWRVGPKVGWWILAGIVGLLATLYLQVRTPQPAANDISKFVSDSIHQEQVVTVHGKVASTPRLTRSQRGQFWLEATQIDEIKVTDELANVAQSVTGKLYVTVPLLQVTGLYPGQAIAVSGNLYKPKSATNPGSFDFRKFLEQEGTFAGISGQQISFPIAEKRRHWGWWVIRQRIVRSQVRFLGSPEGPLAASMVLGSKAVNLPYDIRDSFIQVGLAHALAASGFQTSLILSLLLALTKRLSPKVQVGWGVGALIIFLGLTGLQPSVLRAVVMGFGALIALAMRRKVKPLSSLLIAATLLLIFNPIWIWDLGFQLSFLATLGLLVTVPPLIKRLDWMPPAIACLIAVPIAASVWTLPLQLHVFSIVPVYSLVVNILTTPLISVISIGGIISALIGLI